MVDHSGWVLVLVCRMSYIAQKQRSRYEIRDTSDELRGDVAQLGERRPRTAEVSGSIPLISTNYSYIVCRILYVAKKIEFKNKNKIYIVYRTETKDEIRDTNDEL